MSDLWAWGGLSVCHCGSGMQGFLPHLAFRLVPRHLPRSTMSAIQLTRGFKYVPCEVVRSHAQRTLVTRLLCPLRHPQLSNIHVTFARRAYSRQPVYALAAADGADPLASTQTPSSNPAAQGLSDEEQKNSRNALHATPDPAVSGVDSRAMPEGDEDVEMLNAVSGSQPEAQLVTDKPTELPEGVKVEAVLRDVAPQESTPASAQSVEQPLASITLSTPIQDAIPVPLATQDLASPDTPTAANVVSPGATTAATNSSNISPIKQDWDTILQQFLDMLQLKGHYRSRVLVNSFSIAVLKKGILDFARSRQDILFSLPEEKVRAVLAAGVPYDERKVCNSAVKSPACACLSCCACFSCCASHAVRALFMAQVCD